MTIEEKKQRLNEAYMLKGEVTTGIEVRQNELKRINEIISGYLTDPELIANAQAGNVPQPTSGKDLKKTDNADGKPEELKEGKPA